MRATRMTVPALGASLALLVSACGGDSSRAEDPASDGSSSASQTPSTDQVVLIDFGQEPAVKPRYKNAALRAVTDNLITMVPSTLPDGWTTVGGGYRAEPQWWHMEFTTPTGEVTLDQFPGKADQVLGDTGVASSGQVDLSAWGIGTWSAWDSRGATVLTFDLKGSTVVLQGADQDTVEGLAKTLLPAEDGREQDG